jgi:hypothetical protein
MNAAPPALMASIFEAHRQIKTVKKTHVFLIGDGRLRSCETFMS